MKLVGERVIHISFGEGEITEAKSTGKTRQIIITVEFSLGKKSFIFPDSFEKNLSAKSGTFEKYAKQCLEEKNNKESQLKDSVENRELRKFQIMYEGLKKQIKALVEYQQIRTGDVLGASPESVFFDCCQAFGWDTRLLKCLECSEITFLDSVTAEEYDVWFLSKRKWIFDLNYGTKLSIEEQWWNDFFYFKSRNKRCLIFAQKDNQYVFLGVFECADCKEIMQEDKEDCYIRRYELFADTYPK